MNVLKVGGGQSINFDAIADFIRNLGEPTIVVLGANSVRNQLASQLGITPKILTSASGVSSVYTDDQMIDLIGAAYSGIRRNRFVATCQKNGINAIGLSGLDARLIEGRRTKGIRAIENGKKRVVRDLSGKPNELNAGLLESLLAMDLVPVLTIPIMDEHGIPLNSENDDIVALIAEKMKVHRVIHFIEAEGLLGTNGRPISELGKEGLLEMMDALDGRIKRKLMSLLRILDKGIEIRIMDGRSSNVVEDFHLGKGTIIANEVPSNKKRTRPETQTMVLTSKKSEIYLERAEGIYVYDHNGKRYLDCSGGWGVALLGHRHSNVTQAMIQQLSRIMTSPINHRNSTREEFVDFLLSLVPSPLNRVFLSNSGTEAVEAALKFAIYTTGRSKIVSHVKGFHGRTLGSLSVTHNPHFRRPFEDLLNPDRITFIPLNNLELARKSISNETAAVIIEAIQGEGGVNQASDEYLQGLREICNHTGTLLIIDEIQTGLGRTGNLFAFEKSGIVPDILCLAKGLGGGFPIGATIVSEKVDVAYGMHGSTFGGNPMACAAGLATLQTLVSDGLIENAQIQGDNLLRRLKELSREFPLIREIRGRGLMIAIVLRRSHKTLLGHLLDKGILSIPTGRNIIRLLPPLTISSAEIDQIVCGLRNALLKTNDKVFKRTNTMEMHTNGTEDQFRCSGKTSGIIG